MHHFWTPVSSQGVVAADLRHVAVLYYHVIRQLYFGCRLLSVIKHTGNPHARFSSTSFSHLLIYIRIFIYIHSPLSLLPVPLASTILCMKFVLHSIHRPLPLLAQLVSSIPSQLRVPYISSLTHTHTELSILASLLLHITNFCPRMIQNVSLRFQVVQLGPRNESNLKVNEHLLQVKKIRGQLQGSEWGLNLIRVDSEL